MSHTIIRFDDFNPNDAINGWSSEPHTSEEDNDHYPDSHLTTTLQNPHPFPLYYPTPILRRKNRALLSQFPAHCNNPVLLPSHHRNDTNYLHHTNQSHVLHYPFPSNHHISPSDPTAHALLHHSNISTSSSHHHFNTLSHPIPNHSENENDNTFLNKNNQHADHHSPQQLYPQLTNPLFTPTLSLTITSEHNKSCQSLSSSFIYSGQEEEDHSDVDDNDHDNDQSSPFPHNPTQLNNFKHKHDQYHNTTSNNFHSNDQNNKKNNKKNRIQPENHFVTPQKSSKSPHHDQSLSTVIDSHGESQPIKTTRTTHTTHAAHTPRNKTKIKSTTHFHSSSQSKIPSTVYLDRSATGRAKKDLEFDLQLLRNAVTPAKHLESRISRSSYYTTNTNTNISNNNILNIPSAAIDPYLIPDTPNSPNKPTTPKSTSNNLALIQSSSLSSPSSPFSPSSPSSSSPLSPAQYSPPSPSSPCFPSNAFSKLTPNRNHEENNRPQISSSTNSQHDNLLPKSTHDPKTLSTPAKTCGDNTIQDPLFLSSFSKIQVPKVDNYTQDELHSVAQKLLGLHQINHQTKNPQPHSHRKTLSTTRLKLSTPRGYKFQSTLFSSKKHHLKRPHTQSQTTQYQASSPNSQYSTTDDSLLQSQPFVFTNSLDKYHNDVDSIRIHSTTTSLHHKHNSQQLFNNLATRTNPNSTNSTAFDTTTTFPISLPSLPSKLPTSSNTKATMTASSPITSSPYATLKSNKLYCLHSTTPDQHQDLNFDLQKDVINNDTAANDMNEFDQKNSDDDDNVTKGENDVDDEDIDEDNDDDDDDDISTQVKFDEVFITASHFEELSSFPLHYAIFTNHTATAIQILAESFAIDIQHIRHKQQELDRLHNNTIQLCGPISLQTLSSSSRIPPMTHINTNTLIDEIDGNKLIRNSNRSHFDDFNTITTPICQNNDDDFHHQLQKRPSHQHDENQSMIENEKATLSVVNVDDTESVALSKAPIQYKSPYVLHASKSQQPPSIHQSQTSLSALSFSQLDLSWIPPHFPHLPSRDLAATFLHPQFLTFPYKLQLSTTINATTSVNISPLHITTLRHNVLLFDILLSTGCCDITISTHYNRDALAIAVRLELVDFVEKLLLFSQRKTLKYYIKPPSISIPAITAPISDLYPAISISTTSAAHPIALSGTSSTHFDQHCIPTSSVPVPPTTSPFNSAIFSSSNSDIQPHLNVKHNDSTFPTTKVYPNGSNQDVYNSINVNQCDIDKYPPIYWAVIQHRSDIVQLLIFFGADVNFVSHTTWLSLLHHAVCSSALNDDNDDDDDDGDDDEDLEDQSLQQNYNDRAKKHRSHDNVRNKQLGEEECVDDPDTCFLLLSAECSIDCVDADGRTPLYLAVTNGLKYAAHTIMDFHPTIDIIDNHDVPLIHRACLVSHYSVVQRLLELQTDVNVQTSDGDTPIFWACERKTGSLAMVKTLLRAGAVIHKPSPVDGLTPAERALQCGNPQTAQYLKKHLDSTFFDE